jgi:thioredoxin-like negative regulator of GroEL
VRMEKGRWGTVGIVAGVDEFDEIEFQAARTGNHVRAAVSMSKLALEAEPGMRAEPHVRAGEQWMMADDAQRAADEFVAAIEDGGPTFADPRVYLARALINLERESEAEALLSTLTAERDKVTPRTCDLIAELLTEQADLPGALDWATAGVEQCIERGDDAELQLLLRLRYRIRVDLGLPEDDYDRMLDVPPRGLPGGTSPAFKSAGQRT